MKSAIRKIGDSFYRAVIEPESDATNPRTDCDWLGTMVCAHRGYTLGDKQAGSPWEVLLAIGNEVCPGRTYAIEERVNCGAVTEAEGLAQLEAAVDRSAIKLPLYLYDHSGITMSTTPFSCRWDSGQVGFIYCAVTRARKEVKHGRRLKRVEEMLRAEVATYDQYLTGDVWWFKIEGPLSLMEGETVEDENDPGDVFYDDPDEVVSCGNFYGDDPEKNGMLEHVSSEFKPLLVAVYQS